ncbi:hypothetical protein ACNKHT_01840 [Shigella flexneri]
MLASEFRDVLRCIRCGACMNTLSGISPYWRSWIWLYLSRAIGAVISPLLGGYKDFKDLPYACSLALLVTACVSCVFRCQNAFCVIVR